MEKYLYINYAYEDQEQVQALIERLQGAGLEVRTGNMSEEGLKESFCVLHLLTQASRTSKSYRKIFNYTLKHELDCMIFHMEGIQIASDVERQMDILYTMLKYQRQTENAQHEKELKTLTEQLETAKSKTEKEISLFDGQEASSKKMPIEQVVTEKNSDFLIRKSETQTRQGEKGQISGTGLTEIAESEKKKSEQGTKERQNAAGETQEHQDAEDFVKVRDERELLFIEGKRYMTGEDCEVDMRKAVGYFKQAAAQGHIEAQYQLSVCYGRGIGMRRNIVEAAKWCQMAAYGGHIQAQSEIGYCYEYGQGVVRDSKEAVRWYEIASEQGNLEAMNNLAFCYQKGKGVTKNMGAAIRLYQEAANQGHASSQYNLGFCYWYGEGVRTDKGKAIELFKQSADNGNAKAGQMLKILNQRSYVSK